MKHRVAFALAVVLALTLGACSKTAEVSVSDGPTATAVPPNGAQVEVEKFAAALKLPDTVILDVRTPAEYDAGHLPNAVNLDVSSPEFASGLVGLDPNVPYAVYCRSGNRSATATAAMKAAGFLKVYDLAGGIQAWESAGGEVVKE
ncbi:MAG TPA: rhodanese-like domain-containing protein [Marmoricola sp.]|nr:rhodanese-like domain-containing protein [Marmoricola sp.]